MTGGLTGRCLGAISGGDSADTGRGASTGGRRRSGGGRSGNNNGGTGQIRKIIGAISCLGINQMGSSSKSRRKGKLLTDIIERGGSHRGGILPGSPIDPILDIGNMVYG